jgi:bacillithiol biosynthesis cysteine-adding enzyme BshC
VATVPNLDLIVDRPAGTRIVQDYLASEGGAVGFFAGHFTRSASYAKKAAELDGRFDRAARERASDMILVPGGADGARLRRFVDEGGYVVTTGQQPALFGGPMYTIYKALTAVRLAEALEERLGRIVLPLFWVASEDHDWEEANHADVVSVNNDLVRLELDRSDSHLRPPLHRITLSTQIEQITEQFIELLPSTEFSNAYITLIRDAFVAGGTLPRGYSATMQQLLGRFGLFFTDAAHPALKHHSSSLLRAEIERAGEMEHVLEGTADVLQAAGYDLQVPILEGGLNLFLEGPGGRERLYREGGALRLRSSGTTMGTEEVLAAHDEDPTVLSPNVLLRPVVESALFPSLAYVGGPGEMAYFAQIKDYFRAHDLRMPVVYPRWAVTAVEGKIRKVLDKFDVDVGDLDRPFHEIAGEMARAEVPEEVRAALGKLRGAVASGAGELQRVTKAIDPTLKGTVHHMRSQAFAAIDDLEAKIVGAVKRETDIALTQLEKAQVHLFPLGKPQERVQSPFYFLTRYGDAFLDSLYERFAVNLE